MSSCLGRLERQKTVGQGPAIMKGHRGVEGKRQEGQSRILQLQAVGTHTAGPRRKGEPQGGLWNGPRAPEDYHLIELHM